MKIGVLSPTTIQFVEKMAALFPGQPVTVVGPANNDQWGWNKYERRAEEWREAGLKVEFDLRPYSAIDFSGLDVLVETFETLGLEPTWREHCGRYECPTIVKACWTRAPADFCTEEYFNKTKELPIFLEMPAHLRHWEMSGFTDVSLVFNPVGQWWFDTPWTGADERAVMVLSGKDQWREKAHHGLDLVDRLNQDFPGRIHIHDGLVDYKSSQDMSRMLAGARIFLALDEPYGQGERPLSLVFTEALSVGCPVAARDLPGLSYKDYIQGNGVATNDYPTLRDMVGRCLNDFEFARACSMASRRLAEETFSLRALQPVYLAAFERAVAAWRERDAGSRRTVRRSRLWRLAKE